MSKRSQHPRGFSMIELVVALAVTSVLMLGLTSAVMITARSVDTDVTPAAREATSREILDTVARDLQFALAFGERTDTAVTFTVPDRDGSGAAESIRYVWSGVRGESSGPLTRQVNGGEEVVLAADVQDFNLDYLYRTVEGSGLGAGSGTPLLLVVADAESLTAQDSARIGLLESWGFAVTLISASESQAAFDTASESASVAYVTEQNQSIALGTKLRAAPIGVVLEEAELYEAFGFARDRQWPALTDTIEIVDSVHYITSPFEPGPLAILVTPGELVAVDTGRALGLEVLAEQPSTGRPALSVIDVGGDLRGDTETAMARRVQLPWGRSGFDISDLNDDGRTVMKRAVQWASAEASGEAAGGENVIFGFETEFGTPVSNVRWTQIATQVVLAEPILLQSISAFIGGASSNVHFAIYADDDGEPGALLSQSTTAVSPSADEWLELVVPGYPLSSGTYWLALAFKSKFQRYHQQAGGQTRYRSHDAAQSAFLPNWGASDDSFGISISIYGSGTS